MTHVRSFLTNPVVSMALIAGSVAATGCMDSAPPASTPSAETSADHTVITEADSLALQSVQYQRTAQGDKVAGWTQTAAGEWTKAANGATTTLKVAPVDRDALPPPPVTCNLNFYIGASTPTGVGFAGEAAIGQADCLDGTLAFTITTTACTDLFGCITESGAGSASPGAPFTFGIAVPGTAGAACSGAVTWVPPSFTESVANPCG